MRRLSLSKFKTYVPLAAIIGCLTGLISLLWQFYNYYVPSPQILHATFRFSPAVIHNGKLSYYVDLEITNSGREKVYLKQVAVENRCSDSLVYTQSLSGYFSSNAIEPAAVYRYRFSQIESDKVMRFFEDSTYCSLHDTRLWVYTSIGKRFEARTSDDGITIVILQNHRAGRLGSPKDIEEWNRLEELLFRRMIQDSSLTEYKMN